MTQLWSDLRDPVKVVVSICIAYSAVTDDSLVFVLPPCHVTDDLVWLPHPHRDAGRHCHNRPCL